MPAGRPSKYKKEFCQAIIDFFTVDYTLTNIEKIINKNGSVVEIEREIANDLPLFGMFANSIDVAQKNITEWTKKKIVDGEKEVYKYPEFRIAYKKAKELQQAMWISNSMKGLYNTAFTIFLGKNIFRWSDRQDIDVKAKVNIKSDYDEKQISAIAKRVRDNGRASSEKTPD